MLGYVGRSLLYCVYCVCVYLDVHNQAAESVAVAKKSEGVSSVGLSHPSTQVVLPYELAWKKERS